MWYCGWPADWGGSDACHACYAESDNGIDWVKPKLNVVKDGAGPSHRLNLPMASVFIDPDALASHRYRGLIGWALAHRGRTLLLALVAIVAAFALPAAGLVGGEFMPRSDSEESSVVFETPVGCW